MFFSFCFTRNRKILYIFLSVHRTKIRNFLLYSRLISSVSGYCHARSSNDFGIDVLPFHKDGGISAKKSFTIAEAFVLFIFFSSLLCKLRTFYDQISFAGTSLGVTSKIRLHTFAVYIRGLTDTA